MRQDIKDYGTEIGHGFRIGDLVRLGFNGMFKIGQGPAQIIGYDENHAVPFLVQIDGHKGHNGSAPLKYGEHGKNMDCMWFRPERLTRIISAKENEK
jgi:hypothetical protein